MAGGRRIPAVCAIVAAALLLAQAAWAQFFEASQPAGRWSRRAADPCRAKPGGDGRCDGFGNWVVDTGGGLMIHTPAGLRRYAAPTPPMPPPPPPPPEITDAGRWSVVPGDPCVVQPLPPGATGARCGDDQSWVATDGDGDVFIYSPNGTITRQRFRRDGA